MVFNSKGFLKLEGGGILPFPIAIGMMRSTKALNELKPLFAIISIDTFHHFGFY
jgi:hypothetical protein